ncbi:MAG: PDZ domain-containing protein [Spirochaetales bacterium]|nr:PDZ domain-containing protein [Spirochaetales bacterium]
MSTSILNREFNLGISASVSHAVQFVSVKGEVLYELVSDPIPIVQLSPTSASFQSTGQAVYRTTAYREGWAVHADGSIEIQARALADLDTVRYVIQPGSINVESSFGLGSDLRWRSLITHAYRKYSIKVASQAEDPAPQFKDVIITDSFFTTADPALGRVPILPRNDRVAGYAHLTAVVYFADNTKDAVTATWQGAVAGDSKPYVGEVGPNTVLYFDAPGSYTMRYGPVEFTARLGQAPIGKTATVTLGNGASWYTRNSVSSFYLHENTVFTTDGEAVRRETGALAWRAETGGYELFMADGSVMILGSREIKYLDAVAGTVQRSVSFSFGEIYAAQLVSGKVFARSDYGLYAIDVASGVQLWKASENGGDGLAAVFGRVYSGSGRVYDASTGVKLFDTEGRGQVTVTGDRALWANGLCADRETGKPIWKYYDSEQRKSWSSGSTWGTPIVAGDIVFFGAGAAVRLKDGTPLWKVKNRPTQSMMAEGRLFGWTSGDLAEYDPATGERLWLIDSNLNTNLRAVQYHDGFLYASFSEGGLARIDLSMLTRELDAAGLAKVARLYAMLRDQGGDSGDYRGIKVESVVSGGAAEKAGLLPGDYIVGFHGKKVDSSSQLIDFVYESKAGQRVILSIERLEPKSSRYEAKTVAVILGSNADSAALGSAHPGFSLRVMNSTEIRAKKLDSILRQDAVLAVENVAPGSPADKAGMMAGDILMAVGTVDFAKLYRSYDAYREFNKAMAVAVQTRSTLAITVLRDGAKKTLPAFRP